MVVTFHLANEGLAGGFHLDAGPHGISILLRAPEQELHPKMLVATHILKQDRRALHAIHEDIHISVVVIVVEGCASRQALRLQGFWVHLLEALSFPIPEALGWLAISSRDVSFIDLRIDMAICHEEVETAIIVKVDQAEWEQEKSCLEEIERRLARIPGVTIEILPHRGRSNQSLRLQVSWDGNRLGISGNEVNELLFTTEPRVALAGSRGHYREKMEESSVSIVAWMMQPGDAQTVGNRLHELLSSPPGIDRPARPDGPPANFSGRWDARLDFSLGSAEHVLFFEQVGEVLSGRHEGDILSGDLAGFIHGQEISFRSDQAYEGTHLGFRFNGTVRGDSIHGTVDLGEYGEARWTARRPQKSS